MVMDEMKDRRTLALVILIIAVSLVAIPATQLYLSINSDQSALAPEAVTEKIHYPNPKDGMNVTMLGVLQIVPIAPVCSPSCAIQASTISYIIVNGRNYRLVFSDSVNVPQANANGWKAVVTGSFITPSNYQANEWTPPLTFFGDIYVKNITYYRTQPMSLTPLYVQDLLQIDTRFEF